MNKKRKIIFSHITPGYLGERAPRLTLNASFFSYFDLSQKTDLMIHFSEPSLIFPQRVPRYGFFNELMELEGTYATEAISSIRLKLTHEIRSLLTQRNLDEKRSTYFFGILNFLLRYGVDVSRLQDVHLNFPTKEKMFEYQYINIMSQINRSICHGRSPAIGPLLRLTKKTLNNTLLSNYWKLNITNRFIVTVNRHNKSQVFSKIAFDLAQSLSHNLEKFRPTNFLENIKLALFYRGFAMAFNNLSHVYRYLNKSLEISENIQCTTKIEEILKKENLIPVYQTLAKFYLMKKEYESAEIYLKKMIEVDPFDSTGYSELGLFYIHIKNLKKATKQFIEAALLGPPGVGMNWYLAATAFLKQNKMEQSYKYFKKSIDTDPLAISPLLDSIEVCKSLNKEKEAKNSITKLLTIPTLRSQLTSKEIEYCKHESDRLA